MVRVSKAFMPLVVWRSLRILIGLIISGGSRAAGLINQYINTGSDNGHSAHFRGERNSRLDGKRLGENYIIPVARIGKLQSVRASFLDVALDVPVKLPNVGHIVLPPD